MRILTVLDKVQEANLMQILEKIGGTPAALVRAMITEKHAKMFPAYRAGGGVPGSEAPAQPQITGEQLCEAVGGKLDKAAGMCAIKFTKPGQIGGVTITLPVGDADSMLKVINVRRSQMRMDPLEMADLVQKKELTTGAGS